jgi:hypothetical protein
MRPIHGVQRMAFFLLIAGSSACSNSAGNNAGATCPNGWAGMPSSYLGQTPGGSGGLADGANAPDSGGAADHLTPQSSAGAAQTSDALGQTETTANNPPCSIDSDCPEITTRPVGCATVTCSAGRCAYSAADADGDGVRTARCQSLDPTVGVAAGRDCDDANPAVNPLAWDGPAYGTLPNGCHDGLDNDCSGTIDDGVTDAGATCTCNPGEIGTCSETSAGLAVIFPALDAVGVPLGNCKLGSRACQPNGTWSVCSGLVSPQPETCNGHDNDCDGIPSRLDSDSAMSTWLCDADSDGHLAKGAMGQKSCDPPATGCAGSWVAEDSAPFDDCDDTDGSVYPGAKESCDGRDHDCDGKPGNGAVDAKIWSYDADNDLFRRTEFASVESCTAPTAPPSNCASFQSECPVTGWHADSIALPAGDCDDNAPSCNPGVQVDLCDGTDYNCDGSVVTGCSCDNGQTQSCGAHVGFDGRGTCKAGTQTCIGNAWGSCVGAVGPVPEKCGSLDLDCDGIDGDSDKSATDMVDFFCDADGDGYLSPTATKIKSCVPLQSACAGTWRKQPSTVDFTDCDDTDKDIHPGAPERCNLLDDDCDQISASSSVAAEPEEDADGDGYAAINADCSGGDLPKTDCFDADPRVHPGQTSTFSDGYCADPGFPHWCGETGIRWCAPNTICSTSTSSGIEASYDFNCDGTSTPRDSSALGMSPEQWTAECSGLVTGSETCSSRAPDYLLDSATCGDNATYRTCAVTDRVPVAGKIYDSCGAINVTRYAECL